MDALKQTDPEIYDLIRAEERYEIDSVRLIPSENYVSRAVLEATGSILTNKYSEGYSGRRYYEGQRYIDQIETLVVERAKALFGAEHANVQPYSGSPGKPRGLPRAAQAGRHVDGPGAAARRPSDPRMARQRDRNILARGALPGRSREPANRLRRGARSGEEGAAENYRHRRDRLSAPVRLQDFRRDRQRGRRLHAGRHLAHLGTDRRRRASRSPCPTPTSLPRPRTRRCAVRAAR